MGNRTTVRIILKLLRLTRGGAERHAISGYPSPMEIGFYHLTRSTLEQALPKLLAKVLTVPGRAMVLSADAGLLDTLDRALWQADEWLPHNTPGGDAEARLHPIWLTTEDGLAPNAAKHLFLIGGAGSSQLTAFTRVFDLFDGQKESEVEAARLRFGRARKDGHALTYWQQGETGRWEKRA